MIKLCINESAGSSMTVSEFMEELKKTYNKYFPNSLCSVRFSKNLGSSIWIDCYLAGNIHEVPHNIWQNDMFKICLNIFLPNGTEKDSELPETITLESQYNYMALKPSNKYVAFDSKKVPFRKTTGDGKKVIASFDKFVKRLYDSVKEEYNNDNIANNFTSIIAGKIHY